MPLLGKKNCTLYFFFEKNLYRWTPFKKEKRWAQEPKTNKDKNLYKKNWRSNRGKKKLVLLVEEKIEEPKKCTFGRL